MKLSFPFEHHSQYQRGPNNLITDVKGVKVGHVTLADGAIQTGVTALLPGEEPFRRKRRAACHVINGFGKSAGLMQVNELGQLESPIVLTNTLAVGVAWQALCKWLVDNNPGLTSVNPIVMECNDSYLNDIRSLNITERMVLEALKAAGETFEQGAVGAGRGMVCHGLSGGIGSASRQAGIGDETYTVGVLVLSNHGLLRDLTLCGDRVGLLLQEKKEEEAQKQQALREARDQGSVIVILATDAPLSHSQLNRVCKRAVAGLARTGAQIGHGSGEVVLAFSTANEIIHGDESPLRTMTELNERYIDTIFRMTVAAVEEAVQASLWYARAVTGFEGHTVKALRDLLA